MYVSAVCFVWFLRSDISVGSVRFSLEAISPFHRRPPDHILLSHLSGFVTCPWLFLLRGRLPTSEAGE